MPKGRAAFAAVWLILSCAACAARVEPARPAGRPPAPSPVPRETPPRPAAVPTGSGTSTGTPPSSGATSQPSAVAPAAEKAASDASPPATASAYVFSPQQAASAQPGASPQGTTQLSPIAPAKPPAAKSPPADSRAQPAPPAPPSTNQEQAKGQLQLVVVASAPSVTTGGVVTVDVLAMSNVAVVDAPLHLSFDPAVLEFVDGVPGDFLTQGGSSVVFFADGRSRPGDVAVAAGRVDRAQGAAGSGLLCRVRFRGVGAGSTSLAVSQAKAWGTRGEELAVASAGTRVSVP